VSLSCNFTEIAIAALIVGLLLAATAAGRNYIAIQHFGMNPVPSTLWNLRDFGLFGASLGIVPTLMHEAFEFLSGRWQLTIMTDPFFHVVSELFVCSLGGELWFRAVARIRNWDLAEDEIYGGMFVQKPSAAQPKVLSNSPARSRVRADRRAMPEEL